MNPVSSLTASKEHCPLCFDSMVHPENDDRPPVIIFLDMDGTVGIDSTSGSHRKKVLSDLKDLFPAVENYSNYQWLIAKARRLNKDALNNLHQLINRIEQSKKRALVVLSSSWRVDATLKQHREEVFAIHDFHQYLCGKTAPENVENNFVPQIEKDFDLINRAKELYRIELSNRAKAINFWLLDHEFDPHSTSYVILDDDTSSYMRKFGEKLIPLHFLLSEEDVQRACKVLQINY